MAFPKHFCVTALFVSLIAGTLFLSPNSAAFGQGASLAQEGVEEDTGVWKSQLGKQYARVLQSNIRQVREDALASLITVAHRGQYDLSAAVPALLELYADGRSTQERMMAVTALRVLNDEGAIEQLVVLSEDERDRKMRDHVRRNIADYYFTAYPELRSVLGKSKRLTYTRIQRAKREHLKALKAEERLAIISKAEGKH